MHAGSGGVSPFAKERTCGQYTCTCCTTAGMPNWLPTSTTRLPIEHSYDEHGRSRESITSSSKFNVPSKGENSHEHYSEERHKYCSEACEEGDEHYSEECHKSYSLGILGILNVG
jgi:hypothetical protein